jgi:hypothetical protein
VTVGGIVTVALGAILADWGLTFPPAAVILQPTTNTSKTNRPRIEYLLEIIPVNPLWGIRALT